MSNVVILGLNRKFMEHFNSRSFSKSLVNTFMFGTVIVNCVNTVNGYVINHSAGDCFNTILY